VHHIFPKSLLYDAGYPRSEVNAVANFTFLTKQTNLEISNQKPESYLPAYMARHPNVVESHWIPLDPGVWALDVYPTFLEQRRAMLATALNAFLEELGRGQMADVSLPAVSVGVAGAIDDEAQGIDALRAWLSKRGMDSGVIDHEVPARHGSVAAVLDLAWPTGIQPGLTEPVALLIHALPQVVETATNYGYRVFLQPEALKEHVEQLELIGTVSSYGEAAATL
jgi:hypothetical protein